MNQPVDVRPFATMTTDTIATAPAWMLISGERAFLLPSSPAQDVLNKGLRLDDCLCYPCESTPPFFHLPWPVLADEEIIEELTFFAQEHQEDRVALVRVNMDFGSPEGEVCWYVAVLDESGHLDERSESVSRPGYRPGLRQNYVLVWEKI